MRVHPPYGAFQGESIHQGLAINAVVAIGRLKPRALEALQTNWVLPELEQVFVGRSAVGGATCTRYGKWASTTRG